MSTTPPNASHQRRGRATSCLLSAGVVLPEYTRVRVPDDHAIADLAMYNYVEVTPFYCYYRTISLLSLFFDSRGTE